MGPIVWINLLPKLETLIQEERVRVAEVALERRIKRRMAQIARHYKDYLLSTMSAEERALMPNIYDACRLPSLHALASRNDAQGNVSREAFMAVADNMLADAEVYKEEAKEAYQKCLDQKFSARAWSKLLEMYVEEGDLTRSLNAIIRLSAHQQRYVLVESLSSWARVSFATNGGL